MMDLPLWLALISIANWRIGMALFGAYRRAPSGVFSVLLRLSELFPFSLSESYHLFWERRRKNEIYIKNKENFFVDQMKS
jgi:hypothetical protein